MMVLLDGQSGTIVLDPTRDELEDAKTQVSRRHRLELQLECVVEAARGHARRAVHPRSWATWTCPRRSRPRCAWARRASGLLRTEFLLTGRATLPTGDGAGRVLPPVATAFHGQPGDHPFVRPRRRQVPGGVQGAVRGQSVSRLALDSRLPRRARGVPAPDPRHPPRRGGPGRPAHAAARHAGGGSRADPRDRPRGGPGAPALGHPGGRIGARGRHDRDARGGADRRPPGRGKRILQHRDQ